MMEPTQQFPTHFRELSAASVGKRPKPSVIPEAFIAPGMQVETAVQFIQ